MADGDSLATSARRDERDTVETWRLHVLIEAGYPILVAEQVAASDADLHQAVELLRFGCPAATAAEILL